MPVCRSNSWEVEQKLKAIEGVNDVKVEITFDPPYSQEMMSELQNWNLDFYNLLYNGF
jgi:metal-sulfur cluster biosynthetic enzyme